MSKLLLDTHILLWSLLEPQQLSSDVAKELEDIDNEIWISPITIWEILIMAEKGRIEFKDKPSVWMRNVLKSYPFKEAKLNHEVAMQSRLIDLPHQDPADRFIAASAIVYDLILVTSDGALIKAAKRFSILPNKLVHP
jgi:PIN domain nuclease of toxin-antitoxin system